MIDEKCLQNLQEHFCKVTKLYAYALDAKGQPLTELSASREDAGLIETLGLERQFYALYKRMVGSTLEDQVIEDTPYHNVKLAAIAIRKNEKPILYWLLCAVLSEKGQNEEEVRDFGFSKVTTRNHFYQSLDLLRVASMEMVSMKLSLKHAEEATVTSKLSEKEMGETLYRMEALTAIVQFLESDEPFEEVVGEVLKIAGNFLQISSAQIFRIRKDKKTMDILGEWLNTGIVSLFDQTRGIERMPILYLDKPLVISSETPTFGEIKENLLAAHIKGTVILPMFFNNHPNMYVSFNECKRERTWKVTDVKFLNDAAKIIQSILTKRIQKKHLTSSYTCLEAILDNVGCAVYVKDMESGQLLFVNHILKSTFAEELKSGTLFSIFEKNASFGGQGGYFEINYTQKRRWYDLHCTEIIWMDDRKVRLFAIYDITDKKIYQKRIEKQTYTDFLTGLYNRMCCERDLAAQIDNTQKTGTRGALLFLDLDDFKHINDGLGHQYGDVLLKSISNSLQNIEGINDNCYRVGGDEFIIIIPPESYSKKESIIEKIQQIFNRPWYLKDADYYCTMSMGVITFPDEGAGVQDLIKKADIAMYEAKKSGKNRMALYSSSIDSVSNKRLDMEKNMRDAAAGGYEEFEIYFQPIVQVDEQISFCVGAEALVRWNSKEMGFIGPVDFIPLAEYLGLIVPIGEHVLEQACIRCKKWNDHGHPNFKVNVNFSVIQLLQADIVKTVEKVLRNTKLTPGNLTLEVTENLAINDMSRMKKVLSEIKKLGVRIALDDFGTGYSSLNHIREIPLDVIKIDQSFVRDLEKNPYSQAFIKMIIELAENINVNICVEGIETAAQYKIIKGLRGCMIQGYYFDRPMCVTDFEEKYI